jgi:hypothetical protein
MSVKFYVIFQCLFLTAFNGLYLPILVFSSS